MRRSALPHPDSRAPTLAAVPRRAENAGYELPVETTTFVGRAREIEALTALLRRPESRLTTITGPGGVGKTRLAIQVAKSIADEFDRGVRFVHLAAIDDPGLVAPTIGAAFGVRGDGDASLAGRIAAALDGDSLLLVLDNVERLLEAAPFVSQLVAACPTVKVLTTSRALLGVSAERQYPLQPMDLPDAASSTEALRKSDALRLFLARAHLAGDPTRDGRALAVTAVCRRLEGVPLAIELAAAKTRVLGLDDLLERLDRRLALLDGGPRDVPARLRSMRETIAWSYDLLNDEDRAVFRALSVFDGGFTLGAAEAVAPSLPGATVLQCLTTLVDHSLVDRVEGEADQPRYAMLETVREFGFERLEDHGEEASVRHRHLDWFADQIGVSSDREWFEPRAPRLFTMPGDEDNLRSAFEWAMARQEADKAARIALGLAPVWLRTGFYREASVTFERLASCSDALRSIVVAGIKVRHGGFILHLGELERVRILASSALEISRELGYLPGIRGSLVTLGMATRWDDIHRAIALFTEALEISRAVGNADWCATELRQRAFTYALIEEFGRASEDLAIAFALLRELPESRSNLAYAMSSAGWTAGAGNRLDEAERLGAETLALSETVSIPESHIFSLRILGEVAFQRGDPQRATLYFQRALRLIYQWSFVMWEGFSYAQLAMVAEAEGDWHRAALLYGATDANWRRLGITGPARSFATWTGKWTPADEALADPAYAAAFAAGQSLTTDQAFAEAMAVRGTHPADLANAILSAREQEVLRLVAAGHTNREIAESLFLSQRTVDSHVATILRKLDVPSRRAAVAKGRQVGMLSSSDG